MPLFACKTQPETLLIWRSVPEGTGGGGRGGAAREAGGASPRVKDRGGRCRKWWRRPVVKWGVGDLQIIYSERLRQRKRKIRSFHRGEWTLLLCDRCPCPASNTDRQLGFTLSQHHIAFPLLCHRGHCFVGNCYEENTYRVDRYSRRRNREKKQSWHYFFGFWLNNVTWSDKFQLYFCYNPLLYFCASLFQQLGRFLQEARKILFFQNLDIKLTAVTWVLEISRMLENVFFFRSPEYRRNLIFFSFSNIMYPSCTLSKTLVFEHIFLQLMNISGRTKWYFWLRAVITIIKNVWGTKIYWIQ